MTSETSEKKASYFPRSWGAGRRDGKRKRSGQPGEAGDGRRSTEDISPSAAPAEPDDQVRTADPVPCDHAPLPMDDPPKPFAERSCARCMLPPEDQEGLSYTDLPGHPECLDRVDTILDEEPAGWLDLPCPVDAADISRESAEDDALAPRVRVRIVGLRFGYACRVYHFDAAELDLAAGDWVIVKTEKGLGLGQIAVPPTEREITAAHLEGLRKVLRKAGKADFEQKARCARREAEAYSYCLETIQTLNLPMKLVSTECFFDGSKYVFYFTAEGRVDFRELVKLLVSRFPVRIEMRQIGVRHEAKMTGALACCGQELCCSRFLTDFRPVSVKMAKTQNLSLNPTKISGVCGRLMCCLAYEYDIYEEFRKGLPKVGKKVNTVKGEGVVLKHDPLTEKVLIRVDDETTLEVTKAEIICDESPPPPKRGKKKS